MSLITQCPACSTMFRVVPDQLRISEGWVRCGHCDEVFDANAHLGSLDEPAEAAPQAQTQAPASSNELIIPPQKSQDDYDYDLGAAWDNPGLAAPDLVEPVPAEPAHYEPALSEPELHSTSQGTEPVADLHAFEPVAEVHEEEAPAVYVPDEAPAQAEAVVEPSPESVSPSFMRASAQPKKRWIGNGLAATLCTLLLLALLVQVARQERDRLAASAPALRPALVAGCEWLACSVAPLREIESIAIDSSAFTSVRSGVYLLSVTLKNTAATDLAAPALELTLTDMQDQPVVRRVLLAADWSGKPSTEPLLAGAERTAKLPISVPPDAVPHKIAGYKLLAFYP